MESHLKGKCSIANFKDEDAFEMKVFQKLKAIVFAVLIGAPFSFVLMTLRANF